EESIEVEIELNKLKSFENVNIESEVEDDLEFTIVEPENEVVTIEANGLDNIIERLKKADIKAFVKLSNLTTGKHRLDLVVEGPEGITFKPETETVTVRVQ